MRGVFREVDLTHPDRPESRDDAIMRKICIGVQVLAHLIQSIFARSTNRTKSVKLEDRINRMILASAHNRQNSH